MSLYFREYGQKNAPTIIFLHGAGVSSWMWNEQCEALKNQYHCIAIDLPGNGESYQSEWHSLAQAAQEVSKIIQSESQSGKAHVVGLSLGAYAGLKLLECYPEVVESLLVSGVMVAPFPQQWLYRPMMGLMQRLAGWKLMIYASAKMMQLPNDVLPLYVRDNQRLSAKTLGRIYDELMDFQAGTNLKNLPQPVMAVAGEKEVQLIKSHLTRFKNIFSHSNAYLVANAHHGWNGEYPEVFNQMLLAWLENAPMPKELTRVD